MTNEEPVKQPAVCRACGGAFAALTKWNKTGLCRVCMRKVRLGATAGGIVNGPLADRTAFACSALLALAAGWGEEIEMRREMAAEAAANRNYAEAAKQEQSAEMLERTMHSVRDEFWRAGLAAEANRRGQRPRTRRLG